MKIDKVLFSCSASAEYSPFWNLQSKIFRTKLGIEPVCLLYGKKADVNMSEEFGQVIEVEHDPDLPWALQLVWSKFHHPTTEPDTTWLIGDIDLIPLQRAHFIEKLAGLPDDAWVHLNAGGISQPRVGCFDGFLRQGSQRTCRDQGGAPGADLPGHYHVAKGRQFTLFTQGRAFLDQIRHIVDSDRYGMGVMDRYPKEKKVQEPYWYYWCAEENYTSELIQAAIRDGKLNFVPVYYNNTNNTDRLGRDVFPGDYVYSPERAAAQGYVDVHCARPYAAQEAQLARLVGHAWGI